MSRVPGEPLGPDVAITPRCLDAAVEAITTLHEAISPETLADLPERWWGPAVGIAEIRAWAEREGARGDLAGQDAGVQEALAAADGGSQPYLSPSPRRNGRCSPAPTGTQAT